MKSLETKNNNFSELAALFSDLFNLAPFPYILLNGDGLITQVNVAGTRLFGTSSDIMVGKKLSAFLPLDYVRDLDRFLDRLANRRVADSCELTFELPDNSKIKTRIDGTSLIENGRVTHYLVITDLDNNLNETHKAEKSVEYLELSLEASNAGTWELQVDTMRFYLALSNRKLCPIPNTGFDGRYRTFINYIHPEDRQKAEASFRKSIDFGVPTDIICRYPTDTDGICYCRTKGQLITDSKKNKRLAGIMINVTEQVLAEQREKDQMAEQQRLIAIATLQAGENERRRISDMLHDSVNQLLYGVKMKIDVLKPNLPSPDSLIEIDALVDQAIADVRNISFELAPSILVEFGLPAALRELAGRLSSAKMRINTSFVQNGGRPPLTLELNVFRIIQELINNCIKHSGASLIDIKVKVAEQIEVALTDNGKGFDYSAQSVNPSGSGLSSIKNRLALYDGTLSVNSVIGTGTSVIIKVNFG